MATPSSPPPPGSMNLTVAVAGNGAGSITSSPSGINCGSTCSANFSSGATVTLTATPGANSVFAAWSGSCTGTGPCKVTLSQNASVTATFSAVTPALSVALAGTGTGTVTSSPAGINCGATCKANFTSGTNVTLTAAPSTGSTFAGWTGGCSGTGTCTVDLTTDTSVTATFNAVPVALTVSLAGTGSGVVTSSPAGINCGTTCSANFGEGTQVTLSEAPSIGSTFASWGGGCTGTGPCVVSLSKATTVTATFNATAFTLTVTVTGTGTVSSLPTGINNCSTTCNANFPAGTIVSLTANPGTGNFFSGWGGACSGQGACNVTMGANSSVSATFAAGSGLNQINHIIFFSQENRSLDHYFGKLRQYWKDNGYPDQAFDGLPQFNPQPGPAPTNPGCDPNFPFQPPGPGSVFQDCVFDTNAPVTSYHLITQCVENPSPSWNESHVDWNYNDPTDINNDYLGDGNVWTNAHDSRNLYYYDNTIQYDTDGIRAMGYYDGGNPNDPSDPGDLNYYYYMATQFATSDRWFSPVMSRTELNRDFMIGATSGGYAYPEGSDPQDSKQIGGPIIFELLQTAGISWKIYVNPQGSVCENNQTPQCFYDNLSYVHTFTYGQTIITSYPQNLVPISQYFTDLQNGTLPQLAWIEPASAAGLDEHAADYDTNPPCCSVQAGANYASSLINALMTSSSWHDSALIFTYDEFGGFYDHVPPQPMPSTDGTANPPVDLHPGDVCTQVTGPTCNFQWTGYRVPLIVISPYAQKNYVSHTVADTTAVLKMIETRFGLLSLTQRDAAQIDMTEFFNFSNPPWLTPPTPPKQNRGGQCYLDHLP